jgi:hypothetical protein
MGEGRGVKSQHFTSCSNLRPTGRERAVQCHRTQVALHFSESDLIFLESLSFSDKFDINGLATKLGERDESRKTTLRDSVKHWAGIGNLYLSMKGRRRG